MATYTPGLSVSLSVMVQGTGPHQAVFLFLSQILFYLWGYERSKPNIPHFWIHLVLRSRRPSLCKSCNSALSVFRQRNIWCWLIEGGMKEGHGLRSCLLCLTVVRGHATTRTHNQENGRLWMIGNIRGRLRITEYPKLEGTHKDHWVQLLDVSCFLYKCN